MLSLEHAENTISMNVTSRIVDTCLRRHLLQDHLTLNLAVTKIKRS